MLLFTAYAAAVWILIARWRRRPAGLVTLLLAVGLLMAVAYAHYLLSVWTRGRISLPVLQSIFYPYIALVAVGGLGILLIPRPRKATLCPECDYDLAGLIGRATTCPECGAPITIEPSHPARTPDPPAVPRTLGATRAWRARQLRSQGPAPEDRR